MRSGMLATSSHFTTEGCPENRRVIAWKDVLAHFSLCSSLEDSEGTHASARWIVSPLGISFLRISASPQELSGISQSGKDGIWLALHLEGRARLRADSGEMPIAPGDIAYGSLNASFDICCRSNFRQFIVKIPHAALDTRLVSLSTLPIGCIPGRSGCAHVLAGMLGSIAETIDKLEPEQLRPIELALTELLATCIFSQGSEGGLPSATSTQRAMLNRICQLIEARLGADDLSPDSVAEAEGVSPRYVHKLFENAGQTFAHYLRCRRLERCRAELVHQLYAHLSITEICFRWGFNDSSHFSHAFRGQYGVSPRDYRKTMRAQEEGSR